MPCGHEFARRRDRMKVKYSPFSEELKSLYAISGAKTVVISRSIVNNY